MNRMTALLNLQALCYQSMGSNTKRSERSERSSLSLSYVLALLVLISTTWLGLGVRDVQAQVLVAEYRFDDVTWCSPRLALDTSGGGRDGTVMGDVLSQSSPAMGSKPLAGGAADFSGGTIDITDLPLDESAGATNSVSFWMYWDGTPEGMPVGFGLHDLWLHDGFFGFNTFNSDVFGIPSDGLAGAWHHVAAVFTNGSVATNKLWIDGQPKTLSQLASTPTLANAVVSRHMRISGVWGNDGYRFRGMLDAVRVYSGSLTQTEVDADRALSHPAVVCPPPPPPVLVAHYRLDDSWDVSYSAANSVTGGVAGSFLPGYATKIATPPVAPNKPNTCSGASFSAASGSMLSTGNALDLSLGGKNSVSFWMYWDGGNNQMPFGFEHYDLWLRDGAFGFNSAASDIYGIPSAGLAYGWHHVAAMFTNGKMLSNKLWIDGVPQVLTQQLSSPNNAVAFAKDTYQISGWAANNEYKFAGKIDELKVYRGALTDALVQADYTDICVVADWRMDELSWAGVANEVKDSGGGQYHGTARVAAGATSVPTTASVSPAKTSGGTSTCSYGAFDADSSPARTYSYVELSGFPPLPSSFTFAAWIRSTNTSAQHQRILVRDDADNGWGLSLADGTGRPELRFFNRNVTNTGTVTGQGVNPGCGVFCLDTNVSLASNAWYYIAAAIDTAGQTVTLYVFDASGSILAQTSSAFAGTWKDGTGLVTIGGESSASAEGRQSTFHFLGNIDEMRVFSGVLTQSDLENMLSRTRSCSGLAVKPSNFNCVESGLSASNGHLYTQLAGTAFAFEVLALKSDGSVESTYALDADKTVTVELVDGTGAMACSARAPISPTVSQPLVFSKANQALEQGRKLMASATVNKAYANLRCRVTDANQAPIVVGCSTDSFAVRPSGFSVTSSANADASGASANAIPAFKTGASFSLNAASGTSGYDAVPKVDLSKLAAHAGSVQAGSLSGAFGNANVATGLAAGAFNYSEVGYFQLAANGVYDDTFTAVDAVAGDCTADFSNARAGGKVGCLFGNSNATSYFGRFYPDHFQVTAPTFLPGCSSGGFTYMDQALTLNASVDAMNSSGAITKNYNGVFAKGLVTAQMENADSGTPVALARLSNSGAPTWLEGAYPFVANKFLRAGSPDGPFDSLDIGLAVADESALAAGARPNLLVRDMDASSVGCTPDLTGLSTAATVCTATKIVNATKMRFGRLRMGNAYGSELLDLKVPVQAQYWNGATFVQNGLDNCTALSAANLALASYQGGLNAANMGTSHVTVAPMLAGLSSVTLAKPTPTARGSVDFLLNLGSPGVPSNCAALSNGASTSGSLSFLSGMWCGTQYDRDPVARATFGVYKSPLIYRRENF